MCCMANNMNNLTICARPQTISDSLGIQQICGGKNIAIYFNSLKSVVLAEASLEFMNFMRVYQQNMPLGLAQSFPMGEGRTEQ